MISVLRAGAPEVPVVTGEMMIRDVRPPDRAALLYIYRHLGEQSRYQRFLGVRPMPSARDLRYMTDVDHWHREAVTAWSPVPRTPIGVAGYVRCDEFDVAEIAVAVIDEWQRRGVGRQLVLALRERAIRAGIRRFTATTFRDNRGAVALSRLFGPTVATRRYGGVIELSGSWERSPNGADGRSEQVTILRPSRRPIQARR